MPETIGVIGAGRFGVFWGQALSACYPVMFYDTDERCREKVHGLGDWADLESCLEQSLIFLTIPISEIAEFLRNYGPKIKIGSIILDCASVKIRVAEWFAQYLPSDVYYALSHPLFGPDSARQGLKGHQITLMPGRIPFNRYRKLVDMFSQELSLHVVNLGPEEHDRLMAFNLSLIHLLGRTCHGIDLERVPLMMDSLRKLNAISRVVMNDSEQLFRDFFNFNPYSLEVCRKFSRVYEAILQRFSDPRRFRIEPD